MASPSDSFDEANGSGFDGVASDTLAPIPNSPRKPPTMRRSTTNTNKMRPFHPEDDVFAAPESEFHADVSSTEANDGVANGVFVDSDSPILPPPSEMREEGIALREWRRLNAALLEEKEKKEKELLSQILQEASEYKVAIYEKRKVTCENNKNIKARRRSCSWRARKSSKRKITRTTGRQSQS